MCRFTGTRNDRESAAHYGIMGYFDPSRITESTIRDSIRESPTRPLGLCEFFRITGDMEERQNEDEKKGRMKKNERNTRFNRPVKSNMNSESFKRSTSIQKKD